LGYTEREDSGERSRLGEYFFKDDAIEVDSFGVLSYGKNDEGDDSGYQILAEDLCKEDTFDIENTEIIFRDISLDGEGVIDSDPVGRALHEMGLQGEGAMEFAFPEY
jgi:hypothetical protein